MNPVSSIQRATDEMATYQDLKMKICRDAGGPEDCINILAVTFADGQMGIAGLATGHPADSIVPATVVLREELEPHHGPVAHVTLVNEGYMKVYPLDGDVSDVMRGDLEKEYQSRPDSEVREALICTVVSPKLGTVAMATCPYVYDDKGQPVFDEVMTEGSVIRGNLQGVIIEALEQAAF